MNDPARARQRRTLIAFGFFLLVAGIGVMLFLRRMPLPMRLFIGMTDAIAGLVLLLVAQQKLGDR